MIYLKLADEVGENFLLLIGTIFSLVVENKRNTQKKMRSGIQTVAFVEQYH